MFVSSWCYKNKILFVKCYKEEEKEKYKLKKRKNINFSTDTAAISVRRAFVLNVNKLVMCIIALTIVDVMSFYCCWVWYYSDCYILSMKFISKHFIVVLIIMHYMTQHYALYAVVYMGSWLAWCPAFQALLC